MNSRTVLVLSLEEGQHRALLRHPLLQAAMPGEREKPVTIHYDTRKLALQKRGVVLSLRQSAGQWIQVVEQGPASGCGISQVQEWAAHYQGYFDFSGIPEPRLRKLLMKRTLVDNLIPIFEVSGQRLSRIVQHASGSQVRLCLERGWIAASGRRQPVSEISLGLEIGSLDALFEVAIDLAQRYTVVPAPANQVERGYQLFQNAVPRAVNARKLVIDSDATPLTAFRTLALGCLADLHANHEGAVTLDDPEYVHQMRVAIRRLRAAIRIFRPVLPDGFAEQAVPALKELVGRLGEARDLDVLTAEIVAPVLADAPGEPCLAELMGVLTDRVHSVRSQAVLALRDRSYGVGLLRLGRWLHGEAFAFGPQMPPLDEFAHRRLQRIDDKVRRLAVQATTANPESLHELRIGIKYLRYGMEFLGSLNPEKKLRMRLKHLVVLQEELGQLNDLANSQRTLALVATNPRLRKAAGLVDEWHQARRDRLLSGMEVHLVMFNVQQTELQPNLPG